MVVNTLYPNALVVFVHEIGHCLGIAHACESGQAGCTALERTAIMAYDGGTAGLNADDTAAAVALYGPAPPPGPVRWTLRAAMVAR